MRIGSILSALTIVLAATTVALLSASAGADATPPAKMAAVTVPAREIPEPQERGTAYPVPATHWEKAPILWGWTCELPDGSGLAFGGIHQLADDGVAHTQVKKDGQWQPLVEQLRKNNPLQKRHEQVVALRGQCKNLLAKARHIYFEGQPADDEAKLIDGAVDPAVRKCGQDLAALIVELDGLSDLPAYEAGQVGYAIKHLKAAAELIKPFGGRTSPEQLATLRRGQIELELAAEAFDAEPPPRALSRIAYDAKSGLYVIFGGDHMDYSTNDLWVFDPARPRWMQRHPASAPSPRFDAHLDALGDGRVAMRGGCMREKGYVHVGPDRWIYDIEQNKWTADGHQEPAGPANIRSAYYAPPAMPEQFMKGDRPDAKAQSAALAALPVNKWVRLETPIALGGRDWATWVWDFDRDMAYVYGGGHASYCGNDVARYHLATGRWEISDPLEAPLGCWGTNEQYPAGVNFNRRPWCKNHVWNGQAYDPGLKKMMTVAAPGHIQALDAYAYLYDPDVADWVGRLPLAEGMHSNGHHSQLRHTRHGMMQWFSDTAWLFDANTRKWRRLATKGQMPNTSVDSCGMVYDPKRDRMLLTTLGGYFRPYDGQIHALDLTTGEVTALNPAGANPAGKWQMYLREVAWHPASDLFLWIEPLNVDGKRSPELYPAYDAAKNRWVTVKLSAAPSGVCTSVAWDAGRNLFWLGDAGWNGGVWVLRFDPATAEIKPLTDTVPTAPPDAKP